MTYTPLGVPFKLNAQDMGVPDFDLFDALKKGQQFSQSNQMFPQDLRAKMLANQLSQVQAQYAQPMAQQDLQKAIQYNQMYKPDMQSQINLRGAQGNYYGSESALNNLKTQNPGLLGGDEAQAVALSQMGGSGQDLYKQIAQAKINQQNAMANYYNSGGSQLGVGAKEVNNFQNQLTKENPGWDAPKALQAANLYMSGAKTFPDGTPLPPPSSLDQESMNRIVKEGSTAGGLNQQNADAILGGLLKRGDDLMPNASQFAGLAGKGNLTASQLGASLGQNDPKYRDYMLFTRQVVPQLANQMLLTEGARANNTQKQMMLKVADPNYWDSNPQMAMESWKYLTDTFRNTVTPIVAQGVAEKRTALRNEGSQQSNNAPSGAQISKSWVWKNGKLVQG